MSINHVEAVAVTSETAVPRGRKRDEQIDIDLLRVVLTAEKMFAGKLALNGSQIAAIMDRTPQTLKPRLDFLADAGLLERVVSGWTLTDLGRAKVEPKQ